MRTETAFPGARVVDSLPFSQGGTEAQAKALVASGVEGVVLYLGAVDTNRLRYVLEAGLGFMPVTFAGEYRDGAADEIAQLRALSIPKGTTVWLDFEGINAWNTPASELITLIEAWSRDIVAAGYMAGLYVGAPQPLTGPQLYALKNITRYWLGQGRCVGRSPTWKPSADQMQLDAYPDCGWCMRQDWHNKGTGMMWKNTGVYVDTNAIQADHKGRLPVWVRGT